MDVKHHDRKRTVIYLSGGAESQGKCAAGRGQDNSHVSVTSVTWLGFILRSKCQVQPELGPIYRGMENKRRKKVCVGCVCGVCGGVYTVFTRMPGESYRRRLRSLLLRLCDVFRMLINFPVC